MGVQKLQNTMGALILATVSACGVHPTDVPPSVDANAGQTASYRMCETKVVGATASKLSNFFAGRIVRNLEGPATYCLELTKKTGNSVIATLRVEYEDDFGITYHEWKDVYFGELKADSTTSKYKLEVIFITDANLVQIKGLEDSSGLIQAEVRSFTFLSYEDELNAQLQEAADKCKTGQMTVAQCLGYNFAPVMWWNQPLPLSPQDEMVKAARTKVEGTGSQKLGDISIDLSQVVNQ